MFIRKLHLGLSALCLMAAIMHIGSSTLSAQTSAFSAAPASANATAPRRVFVRSEALLVRAAVVEDKLMKRAEFNQLGSRADA